MAFPSTPVATLNQYVTVLQESKNRFAALSIADQLVLLSKTMEGFLKVASRSVEAALNAKHLKADTPQAGEEWLAGPMTIHRNIRLLTETLQQIQQNGKPQLPKGAISTRPDGQVVVRVFPGGVYDKLMFTGFTADVWMEQGVLADEVPACMAKAYAQSTPGAVCLVLGAGNVASIGPMDVLYKMFVDKQVCILKMNPVNEYLGPFIEEAFVSAIEAGYLRVVYGGADVGAHLCSHSGVDEIHITGSDKTHDAIVWGPPGPEREARKARHEPLLKKTITSELGNVSPIIVVPGPWTQADLAFQAENLASMLANNASFNCNAAKLIVQHSGWSLRNTLLDQLQATLQKLPPRHAYYPGAQDRYESFIKEHPEAQQFGGQRTEEHLPWTLIRGIDPKNRHEICFSTEAFCSVLGETALDAENTADFLDKAVEFCNERVWGTLNVTLLVHPTTEKDPAVQKALDRALAGLRYGTIAINHWAALGYGLVVTPWGAHPGHTLEDIQSGRGFVHNTLMLDRIQKGVVRGPFRVSPRPPWFVTSKNTHNIARRLSDFEAAPSPLKLPGIIWEALRN